ncbi:AraC family transcriptional regulator [Emticicia sp. 21SJ11W-3]|uniref:AraC family transcriptional regulator n=1 Tax=Emticicia sp. 21SJ11W-3 TaxID=2916755 RepID=UPI0020A04983|nr:AraC family transcriptional regulator [Emticicia sp. 21SJ11W-3]UTA69348.1 AraC family transcriptional regulator [Emticicia sp. 21SJ11W-3]
MALNRQIKSFSAELYNRNFMMNNEQLGSMLMAGSEKFFIVRVEELIRLMRLPVPPGRVENHTFIYLTEGEAVMRIGSETYKIVKDQCLIVAAGQVFSFDKIDINQGYLVNFNQDIFAGSVYKSASLREFEFLTVWSNPKISLNAETSVFVNNLLGRLLKGYQKDGLQNRSIIQAYLLALLQELKTEYGINNQEPQTKARLIANQFRELLFTHLKNKHLVSEYAELLNITANHLNKSVKMATGKTPTRWIDEAIVLEAKVLLYQSSLSISEIAAEVGLLDQSYFSRVFKKYEGITPLQFRKTIERPDRSS